MCGMTEDGFASKRNESVVKSIVAMASEEMKLILGSYLARQSPCPQILIGGQTLFVFLLVLVQLVRIYQISIFH